MSYNLTNLHPLSVRIDADGDTHAVYELPQPVRWQFRSYDTWYNTIRSETHLVRKMRVCVSTSAHPVHKPVTVIIPYDENDQEAVSGSVVIEGFSSPLAALRRLGFTLHLPLN